jgi:hypothetical protein
VAKKSSLNQFHQRWLVISPDTLATYATSEAGSLPTKVLDLHLVSSIKSDVRATDDSCRSFVPDLFLFSWGGAAGKRDYAGADSAPGV